MVKFAAVWLFVMDMSILAYFFRPNDVGFGFGAFFVLLTIVLSLIFKSEGRQGGRFLYHLSQDSSYPTYFLHSALDCSRA